MSSEIVLVLLNRASRTFQNVLGSCVHVCQKVLPVSSETLKSKSRTKKETQSVWRTCPATCSHSCTHPDCLVEAELNHVHINSATTIGCVPRRFSFMGISMMNSLQVLRNVTTNQQGTEVKHQLCSSWEVDNTPTHLWNTSWQNLTICCQQHRQ